MNKFSISVGVIGSLVTIFVFLTGESSLPIIFSANEKPSFKVTYDIGSKQDVSLIGSGQMEADTVDLETLKALHQNLNRLDSIFSKNSELVGLVQLACRSGYPNYAFEISKDVGNIFQRSRSQVNIVDTFIQLNDFKRAEEVAAGIELPPSKNSTFERINAAIITKHVRK